MRISSISAHGEIGYYIRSHVPTMLNPHLPTSIMEKTCFSYIKKKKRAKTRIFRTQYVCNSLKELLEGFGYELTQNSSKVK